MEAFLTQFVMPLRGELNGGEPVSGLLCRHCGSANLKAITPYWWRCGNCGEVTSTPLGPATAAPSSAVHPAVVGKRRVYGAETIPLPVRTNPRLQLIGVGLGFAAASVYVASAPLAIYYLAVGLGVDFSEVLLLSGVSLIATLWIFQCVAFAAVGFYSSILMLLKKAQIGAGWVTLGVFSISFSAIFLAVGGLFGAWFGVLAGGLVMGAGLLNTFLAQFIMRKLRRLWALSIAGQKQKV